MGKRTWLVAGWALALVLATSCGGDTTGTEALVVVDVPPMLRGLNGVNLSVEIEGREAGATTWTTADSFVISDVGSVGWPLVVAVAPLDGDSSRDWQVTLQASSPSISTKLGAVARSGYVRNEARRFDVCLEPCSGACPVQSKPPGDLPVFDGVPSTLNCPGVSTSCGDGTTQSGEECDDGNTDNCDGCNAQCKREQCGNGNLDCGEECDDGNRTNGDGCSSECTSEGGAGCLPDLSTMPIPTGDLSCVGTRTAPPDGPVQDRQFQLQTFFDGTPVAGACINFYDMNNRPPMADCGSGGNSTTTDTSGNAFVPVSDGWFSYEVFPTGATSPPSVQTFQPYVVAEPMGTTILTVISQSTWDMFGSVAGGDPGTATMAAILEDCAGQPISNAVLRLFVGDPPTCLPNDPSAGHYFNLGSIVDGTFVIGNIPVTPFDTSTDQPTALLEAWANGPANEPVLIACEAVWLIPDGLTILRLDPLRADGPTCPTP